MDIVKNSVDQREAGGDQNDGEKTSIKQKILEFKALRTHDIQVGLARILAKMGYDSAIGKRLRLGVYYTEASIMLGAWRDFLEARVKTVGDKFFASDHAIMDASHEGVKKLMQTEPQIRGNDLGIIRILASSYMLGNPLTLGMNGDEHAGIREVFAEALPQPSAQLESMGRYIDRFLSDAAAQGQLHIGEDLPSLMVGLLHQLVFEMDLSEDEISGSRTFIKGLVLASFPEPLSKVIQAIVKKPIRHRKQLINRYKQSPKWARYMEIGARHQLTEHQVANSLFDMIHIAGTAGTSALMGSVVGVLCLEDDARERAIAEINQAWGSKAAVPKKKALDQLSFLETVIFESARLYPPVRFVSQLAPNAGTVELGGQQCPFQKGTRLLGSIFTANRDAKRYSQPDQFDTERDFSDLLSWNGWDHERVCPGRALSIGVIKTFCLYLYKRYQWTDHTEVAWDYKKVTAVTPNDLILKCFKRL